MQRILKSRSVVMAAVAAALAFGAAQALAAPFDEASTRACVNTQCNSACIAAGYDAGGCANGRCICIFHD